MKVVFERAWSILTADRDFGAGGNPPLAVLRDQYEDMRVDRVLFLFAGKW